MVLNVEKVRELIRLHPSIGQLEIATKLGLDLGTVRTIVNDALNLCQINRCWTPATLSSAQCAQRLDWSTFVLEKSKSANRFIARFDTWIYKHNEHWTFDSNTTSFNEKRAIACFYTATGIRAVASTSDPRLLSSPDILDNCLGHDVKEKRFLYVDSLAYNSARLLDCLHDRNVVLLALPERSPDLALGEPFLEPTFWSNLQRRRFDAHDEGLKEYKDRIGKAVGSLGSRMFERWFERIQRCVRSEGDYVEQINLNVDLNDYNAPCATAVEPNALVPPQLLSVHAPTSDHSSDEPSASTVAATTDCGCVEWQLKEPKIEPKEECDYEDVAVTPGRSKFNDNEQPQIKIAIASSGGYRLVTGLLLPASTRQRTTGLKVGDVPNLATSDGNEQTRVTARQQQSALASSEFGGTDAVSHVGARNQLDSPRIVENDAARRQQQQQQQQFTTAAESTISDIVYPRPAYSYTYLSVLAIKNSPIGELPVEAIYRFICEHFPYFKTAPDGWKNSVRHNLSQNKIFKKIATGTMKKSKTRRNRWIVDHAKAEKLESKLQQKSKSHWQNLREAMIHPENLDLLIRGKMKFVTDFPEDTELEGRSNSNNGSNSQDDEVGVDDEDKDALRVPLNLTSGYVPVPVAKRQKTLAGTMQAVYVHKPAKGRKTPLAYRADPLLEMIE